MLPQVHRLPAKDFPSLLRRGIRLHTDHVDIRYVHHTDSTRIGFVISKSVDKRATRRNRVKRVLSEQIRLILLKNEPHIDAIFLIRKPFPEDEHLVRDLITPLFLSMEHSA